MLALWTGILGSIALVLGAAWPESSEQVPPHRSVKNLLFAIGGGVMLLYAWLNWLNGGDVFFVLLELMVVMASLFMLLGLSEKLSTIFISVLGLIFVSWSVWVFKDSQALFFTLGLGLISVGYVLKSGSKKRQAALLSGSLLIAFFSFLGEEWIFFWLNLIFAVFSGYYLYMLSSRD